MREDQYSAMLKAIEEPGATVWILTSSRPSRLPATIRSRTQRVRFAAISEPAIREFLKSRTGATENESVLLAALAGGSLGRALTLRDKAPLLQRNQALSLLEPALRRDGPGLWRAAQTFMAYGKTGRDTIRLMVEFHQLWLRDLLRARYGASDDELVNRDRKEEIRKAAEKIDATEIRRRLMVLEEMLRSIDGNVSPDVSLFSGLARVAGSTMGENEWPRHLVDRWSY
jgi:DNA polymerase-3 subunit delta'